VAVPVHYTLRYTTRVKEQWVDVIDYKGLYQVSDAGRVRSLPRPGTSGGVLKPDFNPAGYPCVRLSREGRKRHLTVHTLVITAFRGPRPSRLECRHMNGDPADVRLANLRYGSSAENSADMIAHGRTNSRITHCPSGHEYTAENTYRWGGSRYCRACNRPRSRDGQRRRREGRRRCP